MWKTLYTRIEGILTLTNIIIHTKDMQFQDALPTEIVERKGLGHPDTICNSIVDQVSIDYSNYCIKMFGKVLHHNFDKALLAAGKTEPAFGGGHIEEKMTFILGDRATKFYDNKIIPVDDIAKNAMNVWFGKNMRFIKPNNVWYNSQVQMGSGALQDIFKRDTGKFLPANDTSAAVGFAPLSNLEQFVIELEHNLNRDNRPFEFAGEDIKLMAVRSLGEVDLTVACAMVDSQIKNEADYFYCKGWMKEYIENFMKDYGYKGNVVINALDVKGRGTDGLYLTVTGTSAESGDSGQVGRGNNPYGIIPLNRPMSVEAAAGKNPISHIGKIYNLLCFDIADQLYQITGLNGIYVWMVSRIGTPINEPTIVNVDMPHSSYDDSMISDVVRSRLDTMDEFCLDLISGKRRSF